MKGELESVRVETFSQNLMILIRKVRLSFFPVVTSVLGFVIDSLNRYLHSAPGLKKKTPLRTALGRGIGRHTFLYLYPENCSLFVEYSI
jgi:hypothetical protein